MELCNSPCPKQTRHYEIQAIEIPIVYNKYGDHDPDGLLYVLKKDGARIRKGVYLFHDMSDTRNSEKGTNIHGLFADIYSPGRPAFREYAVFFHDELEILDKNGNPPKDPHSGLPSSTTGISYRSEPMRNRPPLTDDHMDSGEDISMSSWVYGDPAPPILRAYAGDPSKIRLIHGEVKETHVFHLHNHQWRLEGDNPVSTILDSITLDPQECYTLDILQGAGSLTQTIGDVIFHCHLYQHFHEGMWTLLRIHDRLEDGTGRLPDGTEIPPLLPLKDRTAPPPKDEEHPGYPNFINGTFSKRPLQPPLGILNPDGSNKIAPTSLERSNFTDSFVPGALYSETCPCIKSKKDCGAVHGRSSAAGTELPSGNLPFSSMTLPFSSTKTAMP